MNILVFGLTISSAWGNGHATLWRALCRALGRRGHTTDFFERDVPYYASHRDLTAFEGARLHLYRDWSEAAAAAERLLPSADVAIVTSYCPDAVAATDLVLGSAAGLRVFYDLDTPVTLARLRDGEAVGYIGPGLLTGFDLVLSYTGGAALDELRSRLCARFVAPLYGHVDPAVHRPMPPAEDYRADLSYLGTYAADRQAALESLFVEPARRLPVRRFLIGGAQYPQSFPWAPNIYFVRHVEPGRHGAFFSSSRLTLNVTRRAMAAMGHCPSGRLFEAAACGAAIVTDRWEGLETFFSAGDEVLTADTADDVIGAMNLPDEELSRIGRAARERVLAEHTAEARARDFERAVEAAWAARRGRVGAEPAGAATEG